MNNNLTALFFFVIPLFGQLEAATGASPDGEGANNPEILRIDGASDLGIHYTGNYSAPAHKGRPAYTYSWSGKNGFVPNKRGYETTFTAQTIGNGSITASIVDRNGKTHSMSKPIIIHEEVEIFPQPAVLEEQLQHKKLLLSNVNRTTVTQTPTLTNIVTWNVELGVSGEYTHKLLLKLAASIKTTRAQTETRTIPVVTPPNTTVDVFVIPTVYHEVGTWKEWRVGLHSSGNYEHRKNKAERLEYVETPL